MEHEILVPVSAIEHFSYCPRQCALIHVERCYEENLYTLRGLAVHDKVDEADTETIDCIRIEYSLPIFSVAHGLTGKCDVVEFHEDGVPYPVEYKHGPRRAKEHDELQLAAQAICLEEMLSCSVPKGAIYHHSSRRRREVEISGTLKERTLSVIAEVRRMLCTNHVPPPTFDNRCKNCSLIELCQPQALSSAETVKSELAKLFLA